MSEIRYPFDRLEALVVVDLDLELNDIGQYASRTRRVAELLGVHGRQIYRWRQIGVTAAQADVLAVRAHRHPLEVWPELVPEVATVGCADCSATFIPSRRDARFCSRPCYRRWWANERVRRRALRSAPAPRECVRGRCGRSFVPSKRSQKFCSTRCRENENRRLYGLRRYHSDAAYAESRLAHNRTYYAECADALRLKQRARRSKAAA